LFEHGIKVKPRRNAERKVIKSLNGWSLWQLSLTGGKKEYAVIKSGESPRANDWTSRSLALEIFKHKAKRNPSAKSIRQKFAGRTGKVASLHFSDGTPAGSLAKLGRIKSITTRRGKFNPGRRNPHDQVWLCADTKEKLHLGHTKPGPLYTGPAQDFGEITRIEYWEKKPHLGDHDMTEYYHHMGEENGRRPRLVADGKGNLYIKGGAYKIRREGIVN